MQKITFDVDNGNKLELTQHEHDGKVFVNKFTQISAGDMVMLINYYKYVKQNDIQCDFINPDGKNSK